MKPYIFDTRNLIHIVDIRETLKGLLRAKKFITRVVSAGGDVVFVGCKRQARDAVRSHAERCGMHFVNERWLGGTLTNFRTIRARLQRLEELEALVAGPTWESAYSKKMQSTLQRELKKIRRNLDGIRKMTRLPAALIIVDVTKEANAVREARALGVPTIGLIDTDSDPDAVSIAIPGNDDAIRSIDLVLRHLADAVEEGKRARPEPTDEVRRRESAPRDAAPVRTRARRLPRGGELDADATTTMLEAAAAPPPADAAPDAPVPQA